MDPQFTEKATWLQFSQEYIRPGITEAALSVVQCSLSPALTAWLQSEILEMKAAFDMLDSEGPQLRNGGCGHGTDW